MRLGIQLCLILASSVLVGCGGFDSEYDCNQQLACDGDGDSTLEACVDTADAVYDSLDEKDQEKLDEAYDTCKDKKGCDYLDCRDAELAGIDSSDLSKSNVCGVCTDPTFMEACSLSYDACEEEPGCELIDLAIAIQDACSETGDEETCGDDYADDYEDCDGTDLWGETCLSVTAGTRPNGVLGCNSDCTFNVTMCTP